MTVSNTLFYRELQAVGVKGNPSEGAFYFMPDFEVCRSALAARGITTGREMVEAILQEADVAVSRYGVEEASLLGRNE